MREPHFQVAHSVTGTFFDRTVSCRSSNGTWVPIAATYSWCWPQRQSETSMSSPAGSAPPAESLKPHGARPETQKIAKQAADPGDNDCCQSTQSLSDGECSSILTQRKSMGEKPPKFRTPEGSNGSLHHHSCLHSVTARLSDIYTIEHYCLPLCHETSTSRTCQQNSNRGHCSLNRRQRFRLCKFKAEQHVGAMFQT